MANPTVVCSEFEVKSRLEQFGLKKADLVDVAISAVAARYDSVELLDPPGAGGTFSYIYGTRALRRALLAKQAGWQLDTEGQIAGVVNQDLGVKFVFQNTDTACSPEMTPKAISGKGPAASKQVSDGMQKDLFPDHFDDLPSTQSGLYRLWFLCVALENDEPVVELYCPQAIENGQFYGSVERIFVLNSGDFQPGPGIDESSDLPDIEVEVTKKS